MNHSYKLIIAYDGTQYCGWQRQKHLQSVDGLLRETFLRSFHQKNIFLVGASRTDAGVHARGQVVRLRTSLFLEPEKLRYVLNRALPSTVQVRFCSKVDQRFHPQHDVLVKTYSYSFSLEKPSPKEGRFLYYFPWELDIEKLKQSLKIFEGTHDFRFFCKETCMQRSTIKMIQSVTIVSISDSKNYIIMIKGQSFLRYMIRRMVGAAFAIASRKDLSSKDLQQLIDGDIRHSKLLITSPAHGLCLESIEYQDKGELI